MKNSAFDVVCPNCNAQVNRPCTQPTDAGRKSVHWFHYARLNKAGSP